MGTTVTNSPSPQTASQAITEASNTNVAAPAGKQTPAPPPKPPEDPQAAANAAKASKQNASERKSQQDMRGQVVQQNLQKQVPVKNKNTGSRQTTQGTTTGTAQKVSNAGAGGQLHHANVARWRGGYLYDFGRPVTKEQAAKFIFEDGKVPKDAKLVQGPGNTWHMQVQGGHDEKVEVYGKMKNPSDLLEYPPLTEYPRRNTKALTWVDGPKEATKASAVSRQDLKNDFGFTITRRYKPDEGQRPTDHLGKPGHAYELSFDKPMTKAQVMDKMLDKNRVKQSEVKLVPIGPEPSKMWQVELIGESSFGFKPELRKAFYDADIHTKETVPTGTPAGLRAHFENRTIPKDAVKLKDPPNTYVWEQDGYMAYVWKSEDGKHYDFQYTKLPTDPQGLLWMRGYMKEKGMPPREAWQAFWNDTKEIARMQLGMIGGASRPNIPKGGPGVKPTINKSPSTGGRVTTNKPSVKVDTPNVTQKPKTDVGTAKTQDAPAPPPPPPKPPAGGRGTVGDSQQPVQVRKPGDMSKSQIDAENASVAGYKPPKFRPSPGDGQVINIEDAFKELRKKNGQVLESGSDGFHKNAWNNWLGQKGEPPLAFRVGGKIRINVERLSPDQRRRFIELEKAQAAARNK